MMRAWAPKSPIVTGDLSSFDTVPWPFRGTRAWSARGPLHGKLGDFELLGVGVAMSGGGDGLAGEVACEEGEAGRREGLGMRTATARMKRGEHEEGRPVENMVLIPGASIDSVEGAFRRGTPLCFEFTHLFGGTEVHGSWGWHPALV